jgi:PHP family Zn ribbon phosphoesterase
MFGPDLPLLLWTPEERLDEAGETVLAEAIRRVRARAVEVHGGYDGEFGRYIFNEEEKTELKRKPGKDKTSSSVFRPRPTPFPPRDLLGFDVAGLDATAP